MSAASSRPGRRRWLLRSVAAAAIVLLLAWLFSLLIPAGGDAKAALPGPYSDALVARGRYLARAGDCGACHTAAGGKPFAGGLPMATPLGTIYSSNITPDPRTGIGAYRYGEFERAVRRGVDRGGHSLYPAMPYPSYARIDDEDMQALYAYFMQGVAPVAQRNRAAGIPWPLSLRWPLAYWRGLFAPSVPDHVAAPGDTPLARGAYLVEGLGHCGACHSPRGFAMQEKALADDAGRQYLSGGTVDHWAVPSLRGEAASGLGSIGQDELVALLKTGRSERGAIFGSMGEVVTHSTQYLDRQDLEAIAVYLKSLAPRKDEAPLVADASVAVALHAGKVDRPGAQLYLDNCATCHRSHGGGYAQTFPALALNPAVNGEDPASLIRLVLAGGTLPGTGEAPTQFSMPAFADRLSDQEVAELLTFVRSSWGNRAAAVDAAQVRRLRRALPPPRPVATDYDPRTRQATAPMSR